MDATVIAKTRHEVRGGTLRVAWGQADKPGLDVGTEKKIVGRNEACDLVLDDRKVSAVHLEVVATDRGVLVRDLGSRNGTFLGETRIGEVYLVAPVVLKLGDSSLEFVPSLPGHVDVPEVAQFGPLVGVSAAMGAVFERCRLAAPTDLTVLVQGEAGTGKEAVAEAIHRAGPRADRPFIAVDCTSASAGHAEGALFESGASPSEVSPLVEAEGGTLFLDEVGELPLDAQLRLLRALSDARLKPGEGAVRSPSVRVIAASRRNLVRGVNEGTFRSDLYFRIAQLRIDVPPLRERLEDVPVLVRALIGELADSSAYERVTNASLERLMRHDWPGNVRELRNLVAVALALTVEGPIDLAQHFSPLALAGESTLTRGRTFQDAKREVLARFEREYFTVLHAECAGNVSQIGRRAAMERAHVRTYLRRHGIVDGKKSSE